MEYFFKTMLPDTNFDEAIAKVTAALKEEGFGVLTEIDVKNTLKEKIDVDFKPYKILGACNPTFAHQALMAEDNIGVFLPCNVIVKQEKNGVIEVAAVDPIASMSTVENKELLELATEVQHKLGKVIQSLS